MALKSHIEGVHEGIKNFTCDRCEKSFSLHQSLKAHIKYYHESNGEENKCDLCNKTFTLPGTLKAHIQEVHRDIKAHQCPYCEDKAFKRSFDLKKHDMTNKKTKTKTKTKTMTNTFRELHQTAIPKTCDF